MATSENRIKKVQYCHHLHPIRTKISQALLNFDSAYVQRDDLLDSLRATIAINSQKKRKPCTVVSIKKSDAECLLKRTWNIAESPQSEILFHFPPVYNGENYHIWAVKMKAFLRGVGLWQYVEEEKQPPPLGPNPTLNQIRLHEEEATKAPKALSILHQGVTDAAFTKIVACETAKEA
ncbi:uncharacterized protein LOC123218270 [Mangifera indica]|uniref:uncharacterized protein LOC123218270 n=1 Tax=Mangifera indica TaxID=29780 RepID=UPI001CFB4846|nr:uncharacterized protein LOC123218270 [Mangifera indica]